MNQVKGPRGWIGIIGAVLVVIGIFLPIISIFGFGFSYLDMIMHGGDLDLGFTIVLCIATVVLAIVGAVLYFMANTQVARILSVVGLIVYLITIFAGMDMGSIGEILGYLGAGFWLMLIGYIVMVISFALNSVNASIDAAIGGNKQ